MRDLEEDKNKVIRFDWAMKRLLRNKANFGVLEGLLTTLLGERITIQKLLESEGNQEDEEDKYNRVDMLAEDSKGELILIEVQNNTESAYFQRMLFGTSKLITEYMHRGDSYDKVRKVYSVNIVYFSLGNGKDYVYHGTTEFRGIHNNDLLKLTPFLQEEYYVLKVNDFNSVAKTPLEEWISYLKTGDIPATATAPGLEAARERLKIDSMSRSERTAYYKQIDNLVIFRDNIETGRAEGRFEGRAEGRAEGRVEGRAEGLAEGMEKGRAEGKAEGLAEGMEKGREEAILNSARNFKKLGVAPDVISQATGLSIEEIENLSI